MHPPGTELAADVEDEAADGLTPPMQSTRTTQFRPQIIAPPHRVTEVEKDIYAILNVRAAVHACSVPHASTGQSATWRGVY